MGFRDLFLFYIILVAAIRTSAMATQMGAAIVLMWVLGFVLYMIPMGAAVSELSDRYPEEGGIYVWTKKAFGDFHGYLAAWFYWTSNLVYFPAALLFVASNSAHIFPGTAILADNQLFLASISIGFLLAVCILNLVGLDIAKYFHNIGAVTGFWLPAAVIIVLGFGTWLTVGSATTFSLTTMTPQINSLQDIVLISVLIYSFAGFEAPSLMSDEIHQPKRNIPRALFASASTMTLTYLLISVCILVIMPAEELSGLQGVAQSISVAGSRLLGSTLGSISASIILVGLVISGVGGVSSWLAASSRLPFVIGIDSYLPASFARLHPRFKTPYVALIVITVLTIGFIIMGSLGDKAEEAYNIFVSLEITVFFIPYLYLFASLIKLRRQDHPETGFRIPGGKIGTTIVGSMGLLVIGIALVFAFIPGEDIEDKTYFYLSVGGVFAANALIGVGLFWWGSRHKRIESSTAS